MDAPLELYVNYELSTKFRALVERMENCKIFKVVEIKSCKVLLYIIFCPEDKASEITEMAFMTWVKNPEYQKYYKEEEWGINVKVDPNQVLINIPIFC